MKHYKLILLAAFLLISNLITAQDSGKTESDPLILSGSIDTYFKSDLSGQNNIGTSFANDNNSFSIGMFNLIASKTIGKASFVADIGIGPRNANSVPSGSVADIQNLYVSYALSDKLNVTAGYMGTFVGYEIISPTGNFNYSTSYLFTNGPFQNAGLKFDFAISDKISLMAGVFNDWNVYGQDPDINITSFGSQLTIAPVEGWDIFINVINGAENGYELDLTTGYQVNDKFYLGLNAASWSHNVSDAITSTFTGAALYAQFVASDNFSIGVRGEQFNTENTGYIGIDANDDEATSITAVTLSANIGSGALKLIPEIRLDTASGEVFIDSSNNPSSSAAQILVAAIFSF